MDRLQPMTVKHAKRPSIIFWILPGILLLYAGYGIVLRNINAAQYEKDFREIKHPADTALVEAVSLAVSYYPATFVGDAIRFKSAYVAGELRSYTGDWQAVQDFYGNNNPRENRPLGLFPIEVINVDGQLVPGVPYDYISSPADYDILAQLREHYDFWGSPEALNNPGQTFYLVYHLRQ